MESLAGEIFFLCVSMSGDRKDGPGIQSIYFQIERCQLVYESTLSQEMDNQWLLTYKETFHTGWMWRLMTQKSYTWRDSNLDEKNFLLKVENCSFDFCME